MASRALPLTALACAALWARPAGAQDASLQAVFSGSVGVTDNVLSISEQDPAGPEADGFGSVSPGLVFRYDTPRTSQSLSYTFTPSFFFRHAEANSYTGTAAWTGRFTTSPTTELTLGVIGAHGQLNTFAATQEPGQTTLSALPPGGTAFVQGGVNEGFSKQLSPVVSVAQGASFLVYSPITEEPPARTYSATNTLSAQRLWRDDTGEIALTFGYTHFENLTVGAPGSEQLTSRDQLLNTLVASWQHDYRNRFSTQVDLGVTQATDLGDEHGQLWQPAGLLAARYVREQAAAELAYLHAAQLNVYLSQIALVDALTLRVALPIDAAARLGAEGSAGVQLAQPIQDGELGDRTTALLFDAALLWSPVTFIPDFELSLRYQRIDQIATAAAPLEDVRLVRNTLVLSVSGAFPETEQTSTRILMTQPFGAAGPARRVQREPPAEEPSDQQPESGAGAAE